MPNNSSDSVEYSQYPAEGSGREDHYAMLLAEAYPSNFTSTVIDSQKSSGSTTRDATAWLTSADNLLFNFGLDTQDKAQPAKVQDQRKVDDANDVHETKSETSKSVSQAEKLTSSEKRGTEGADPKFLKLTDADLARLISDRSGKPEHVEDVKDMYKELIRRYDSDLPKAAFDKSIPSIKLLLDGLKNGTDLTDGPDGKRVLGNTKLTEERRFDLHKAISADLESVNRQIQIRQEYAKFLQGAGQENDAEKAGLEARDLAERLLKPIDVDGKPVRPIDLITDEKDQLINDLAEIRNADKRGDMQNAYVSLVGTNLESGLLKTPINTNKFLAELNLGMKISPKEVGENKGVPSATSPVFKPDKALMFADKALEHTKEILGFDPLDHRASKPGSGLASVYDALRDVVKKPEDYNLNVGKKGEAFVNDKGETVQLKGGELVGKNSENIPTLIEAESVQKLKIEKKEKFDDLLRDLTFPYPRK